MAILAAASIVKFQLHQVLERLGTGAITQRIGRLEAAHGGTLFLDEIGELPHHLQAKLLRAVQAGV